MTAKRDLKKRVRARQVKTGESYTTARSHVLRARESAPDEETPQIDRVIASVLKTNDRSLRVCILGEVATTTLRASCYDAWRVAPGQLIETTLTRRWSWRGDGYASGAVERAWTDVSRLGLEPLSLEDGGVVDLRKHYDPFRRPDPYAAMWESFAETPRRAFEFEEIAWGVGVGVDPLDDRCLVVDAAEELARDPDRARELLMQALLADLRCIDAHVHLGVLAFDRSAEEALTHYEIAVGIGELSLGPTFDGMLLWGHLHNRPFLRAIKGLGLCLWRLDQLEKAGEVFERVLALNPPDNQGARFLRDDVLAGKQWSSDPE